MVLTENGRGEPVGHRVIWSIGLLLIGTSVTFKAYAFALDGTPHPLAAIGTVREVPPPKKGAPKEPVLPDPTRVSMTLHGVTAVKRKLVANSWPFDSGAKATNRQATSVPGRTLKGLQNSRKSLEVRMQNDVFTGPILQRRGGVKENRE